ncbi:MAG TPA: LLM class F420-dependent oxidoreductase [Nitrososphaeraceae archaeon]
MQIGLKLPQTGRKQASKGSIVYLAKEAENAGFNSLWVLERLLWPINPISPYPGSTDGKFPEDWQYIFDPLETLTFVAANTNKIALGTSVIDMLFHNPVILARRFATLDVLSDGRAVAGFGIGWSEDEYRASGIPFINRGKRADECIQLLKMLWTEDSVEFTGEYYDIPASKVGPKPVQKPHIPIYLGGYSQKTFARIAKHANGWICTIRDSLSQVRLNIEKIREECHKVNRDPKDIDIAAILYPNVIDSYATENRQGHENQRESSRILLSGDVDQVGRDLLEIKNIGVGNVIFNYNRSPISNNIDGIIDVSKKLREFIR